MRRSTILKASCIWNQPTGLRRVGICSRLKQNLAKRRENISLAKFSNDSAADWKVSKFFRKCSDAHEQKGCSSKTHNNHNWSHYSPCSFERSMEAWQHEQPVVSDMDWVFSLAFQNMKARTSWYRKQRETSFVFLPSHAWAFFRRALHCTNSRRVVLRKICVVFLRRVLLGAFHRVAYESRVDFSRNKWYSSSPRGVRNNCW